MIFSYLKNFWQRWKGDRNGRPASRFCHSPENAAYSSRWGESGNVFFTLFGAVALVGVVGVATATLMRGPVGTVIKLNQQAKVDAQLQIARKLTALESTMQPSGGDCDGDGYVEPLEPDTTASCTSLAIIQGVGGVGTKAGCLPATVGAAKTDPWNTELAYCGWNHGPVTSGGGCGANIYQGENKNTEIVLAIISAGPDRQFQTTCADATTYLTKGGDDVVFEWTYDEAAQGVGGGLWSLKSTDLNTATIGNGRNIEVPGSVDFQSGGSLSGGAFNLSNSKLSFGDNSLLNLPNNYPQPGGSFPLGSQDGDCFGNAANAGSLRVNFTSGSVLQICDTANNKPAASPGWTDVGGSGSVAGSAGTTPGAVQLGDGSGGFMADETNLTYTSGLLTVPGLHATGAFQVDGDISDGSGDVTIADGLTVSNGATLNSTLDVSGATTITNSLTVSGNHATALGGTLGVSGDATLSGKLSVAQDATMSQKLTVTGATQLNNTLDVTGDTTVNGIFYASQDANISGNANVTGDASVTGDVIGTSFRLNGDGGSFNEGLYFSSGSGLELRTEGVGHLFMDAAGDVGIGISSPEVALDVAGEIKLSSAAAGVAQGVSCGTLSGALTYASGDQLLICSSLTGNWETIGTSGGGGGGTGGVWDDDFSGLYARYEYSTFIVDQGISLTSASGALAALEGAGTRSIWYPSAGAFRAGEVTGTQWDDSNMGVHSTAFGLDTEASGNESFAAGDSALATTQGAIALGTSVEARATQSVALGNQALVAAGSTNSMAIGLGAPTGASPQVTGTNSLGIFSGDQTGVSFAENNTLGLIGMKLTIDPDTTSATNITVDGVLTVDVQGAVGALNYCDESGNFCFTAADVAGGALGAPGNDNELLFNSGGSIGTDPDLIYLRSTNQLAIGTLTPTTNTDVYGANSSVVSLSTGGGSATSQSGLALFTQRTDLTKWLGEDNTNMGWYLTAYDNGHATTAEQNALKFSFWNGAAYSKTIIFSSAGYVGLDTSVPAAQLTLSEQLLLGNVNDCTASTQGALRLNATGDVLEMCDFAGSGGYIAIGGASVSAPGNDREIVLNSGGSLATSSSFVFDSTGHLGIGLANPDDQLDVVGSAQVTGQVTFSSGLDVANATTVGSTLDVTGQVNFSSGLNVAQQSYFANPVGIQDSTPDLTLLLDVEGQVGANQYCDENGVNCFLPEDVANNSVPGADREVLFNSGGVLGSSPAYTFDSGGDLVIGTTAKDTYLSDGNSDLFVEGTTRSTDFGAVSGGSYFWGNGSTAVTGSSNAGDDYMSFDTNSTEYMRLDSAGRFGIGTTTPGSQLTMEHTTTGGADYGFLNIRDNRTSQDLFHLRYQGASNEYLTEVETNHFMVGAGDANPTDWPNLTAWITSPPGDPGQTSLAIEQQAGQTADLLQIRSDNATTGDMLAFTSAGYLGIGTSAPATMLDVDGTIKMAYGGEACDASREGAIQFTSSDNNFYVCQTNGVGWQRIITAGGSGGGTPAPGNNTEIVYNSGGVLYASSGLTFGSSGDFTVSNPGGTMAFSSTGRLGIGATNPVGDLEIARADASPLLAIKNTSSTAARVPSVRILNYTGGNGGYPSIDLSNSRGSEAAPAASQAGDPAGLIVGWGGDGAGSQQLGSLGIYAEQNTGAASSPGFMMFSTTPAGSTVPVERLRIDSEGTLHFQSTGATIMNNGTTGQRPSVPVNGMFRFNTTTAQFEGFNGTDWNGFMTGSAGNDREVLFNSGGAMTGDSGLIFTSAGQLGIGGTANNTNLTIINNLTTAATDMAGAQITATMSGNLGSYNETDGLIVRADTSVVSAPGDAEAYGIQSFANAANDASQQTAYGVLARTITHNSDIGYDFYAGGSSPSPSTGGTQYGLYISMKDAAANRYGIWQNTDNPDYLRGTLSIGPTFDSATQLSVDGTIKMSYGGEACDASREGAIQFTSSDNNFYVCQTNGGGWQRIITAGGGGTPAGGSDRQIQFNSGGSLTGAAGMTFDSAGNIAFSSGKIAIGPTAIVGHNLYAPGDPVNQFENVNTDNTVHISDYRSGDLSTKSPDLIDVNIGYKHTGAGTANLYPFWFNPVINSDSTGPAKMVAFSAATDNYGSGNMPFMIGAQAYGNHYGTGTITNGYGMTTNAPYNYGTGTITTGYGMMIYQAGNYGGGTYNNVYGLYIQDQSGVTDTSDFNIYSAGAGSTNYLEGKLGVGTNSMIPETQLDVDGTIKMAYGGEACDANRVGAIQFDSSQSNFYVCQSAGTWQRIITAGGGGTPAGGSDRQIQFNSGGSLTGSAGMTFDSAGNIAFTSGHMAFGSVATVDHMVRSYNDPTYSWAYDTDTTLAISDYRSGDLSTLSPAGITMNNSYQHTGAGNTWINDITLQPSIISTSTGPIGSFHGVDSTIYNYGSGNVSQMTPFYADVENNGTGTVNKAMGVTIWTPANGNTGTINNGYGVFIGAPWNGGGGAYHNAYGLYIDDQSGASDTSDFNIYSAGATSTNYFAGKLGVGTNSMIPVAQLDVDGTMKIQYGGEACDASHEGAIKFDSAANTFSFCALAANGWETVSLGSGTLAALSDTTITGPATGEILYYSSSGKWVNAALGLNDLSDGNTAYSSSSMYLGNNAGPTAQGANNVALGMDAMAALTAGGSDVAIGAYAMSTTAGTGGGNTVIGDSAAPGVAGANNTYIGQGAANSTSGTGVNNTGVGASSLYNVTGDNNTAFGMNAGASITSGSNNITIGYNIDTPTATTSNYMNLGDIFFGSGVGTTAGSMVGAVNYCDENLTNCFTAADIGSLGGTINFTSLADTPNTYTGQGGKFARVNAGETAMEFTDQVIESVTGQPAPPAIVLNDLGDVNSAPTDGQALVYNSAAGQWEAGTISSGSLGAAGSDRQIQFNSNGSFSADTNFVFTSAGDLIVGSYQIDDTGTGTEDNRMYFDVSNGAFRAGSVDGNQWNFASAGQYSVAFGRNSMANSSYGVAAGYSALASNWGAIALGVSVQASGNTSLALGSATTASGDFSTAMGEDTVANGTYSFATGLEVQAIGNYSYAFGLGDQSGFNTNPALVTGQSSYGIFMGGQDNVNLASANTFGLFGGRMVIDPSAPATKLSADTALDVNGTIKIGYGGEACDATREGAIYYNSADDKFYGCQTAGSWTQLGSGAGGISFTSLTDTPSTYSGQGGKFARVNAGETAMEFTDQVIESVNGQPAPTGMVLTDLGDVNVSGPSGGQSLIYNSVTGKWEAGNVSAGVSVAAGSDRQIQFNSSGPLSADTNFVYTSAGDLIVGSYQIEDTGTGSEDKRMFFDVSNGAFRAGYVDGNHWDYASAGQYSAAFGWNSVASGQASTAFGVETRATGQWSTAAGYDSRAMGNQAVAMGSSSDATGDFTVALGAAAFAVGDYSNALGDFSTASGKYSVVLGNSVVAGDGVKNSGAGDGSFAFGLISDSLLITTKPQVTGDQSFGIFMGDQDGGVNLASSNTMGLFGGKFIIDPAVPATDMVADTALDVNGTIKIGYGAEACDASREGALQYNSATNKFYGCSTAGSWTELGSGSGGSGGGLWSDSGSGYIQYDNTLGGIKVGTTSGGASPVNNFVNALNDLSDVNATATDGASLVYDSASGQWIAGSSSAGGAAGNDREIQFNSGGVMFSSSGLIFDSVGHLQTTGHMAVGNIATPDQTVSFYNDGVWETHNTIPSDIVVNDYRSGDLSGQVHASISSGDTFEHTGASAMYLDGIDSYPTIISSSTGPIGSVFGVNANITNLGSGNVNALYSYYAEVANYGSAVVNSAAAIYAVPPSNSGILNYGYGIRISTPWNGGAATYHNTYGIYIADQSGVADTSDFNIYSAGVNSTNYLEGKLGIGTNSMIPVTQLDVDGTIKMAYNGETCSGNANMEGAIRYNSATKNYDVCADSAADWVALGSGAAGSINFSSLADTPNSYSGQANKFVRVTAGETGVEFTDQIIESVAGNAPVGMALNDLSNVSTTPNDGDALVYDSVSGTWIAGPAGSADTLSGLSCASGEVAQWNGSAWVCSASAGGLWTAGTGDKIYYNSGTPQVGIGNTNPVYALDVAGDIRASSSMILGQYSSIGTPLSSTTLNLNDLGDVDTSSVTAGDVLLYSGGSWVTGAAGSADTLSGLSCNSGEVAQWNGSAWVCTASAPGIWSDSGSGYIEYSSTLGGMMVAGLTGAAAPSGAIGSAGGGSDTLAGLSCNSGEVAAWNGSAWACTASAGGLWTAGAGDDIYYNSGSPRVGIGKTSPSAELDVAGSIKLSSSLYLGNISGAAAPVANTLALNGLSDVSVAAPTNGDCLAYNNGTGNWEASSSCGSGGSGGGLWAGTAGGVIYYDSANVGVGLTNPTEALDVAGNIKVSNSVMFGLVTGAAAPVYMSAGSGGSGGTLDGLTDTTLTSPTSGDILSYNGSAWVNQAAGAAGLWTDSGSGYIEYSSTLGGVHIASVTGLSAPAGAVGSGGGGSGTPGGADTQIQFNNAGAFDGSANLTWSGTLLDVTGDIQASSSMILTPIAGLSAPTSSTGSSTLDGLTDTTLTSPTSGDILSYNGSAWVNQAAGAAGLWTDSGSGYIEYTSTLGGMKLNAITGAAAPSGAIGSAGGGSDTLSGLSCASGQVAEWNGSAWICATGGLWSDSGSGYIEYASTSGGIKVSGVSGAAAPLGATGSSSGGGGYFVAGSGNDIYYSASDGDVGIGGAPPAWLDGNATSDLSIDGEIYMGGDLKTNGTVQVANAEGFTWDDWTTGIWGDSSTDYITFNTDNAERVRLTSVGHFGIGTSTPAVALDVVGDIQYTGTITDISDMRLKKDITPLNTQEVMGKLSQINTYSFRMKDDPKGRIEYGVMAQELEKIFPTLVHTADDKMGTKSVNYMGLIAPLIEASKELQKENDDLKTALAERDARLEKLETAQADILEQVNGLKAYTGYGISKAEIGLWMIAGMGGMSTLFFLGFVMIQRRRRNEG